MAAGADGELDGKASLEGVGLQDEGRAEAIAKRLVGEPQAEDADEGAVAVGGEVEFAGEVRFDVHRGIEAREFLYKCQ